MTGADLAPRGPGDAVLGGRNRPRLEPDRAAFELLARAGVQDHQPGVGPACQDVLGPGDRPGLVPGDPRLGRSRPPRSRLVRHGPALPDPLAEASIEHLDGVVAI